MANPYRDAQGRFASKNSASHTIGDDGVTLIPFKKDNSERNRKIKKAAIIGGAVVGVGLAAYFGHNYLKSAGISVDTVFTDDGISSRVSGNVSSTIETKTIKVVGSKKDAATKFQHEATAVAQTILNDLGYKNQAERIVFHDDDESYRKSIYEDSFSIKGLRESDRKEYVDTFLKGAGAFYNDESKSVFMSPLYTERLHLGKKLESSGANAGKKATAEMIGTIGHEMAHSVNVTLLNKMGTTSRAVSLAEVMSRGTEIVVSNRSHKQDFGKNKLDRDDWRGIHTKIGDYSTNKNNHTRLYNRELFKAAALKYNNLRLKTNKNDLPSVYDIIHQWMIDPVQVTKDLEYFQNVPVYTEEQDGSEHLKLFNPYHDELGRFTSAPSKSANPITGSKVIGNGFVRTSSLSRFSDDEIKTGLSNGRNISAKEMVNSLLVDEATYREKYEGLNQYGRNLIAQPAEYLARKKGFGPKAARFGLDFATGTAADFLIGSAVFTQANILGATATAALLTAAFGTAPAWLTTVGGIAVGVTAGMVVAEIADWATDSIVRGYLNRYAPKDDYHLTFVKQSKAKRGMRAVRYTYNALFLGQTILLGTVIGAIGTWAGFIEPAVPLEEDQYGGINEKEFFGYLQPYIGALLMTDSFDQITIPNQKINYPGFYYVNNTSIMDSDSVKELVEAYGEKSVGKTQFYFGDVSFGTLETNKLEYSVKLFNPYHDALGRFTSAKSSGATVQFFSNKKAKDSERPSSQLLNRADNVVSNTNKRLYNSGNAKIVGVSFNELDKIDSTSRADNRRTYGAFHPKTNKIYLTSNVNRFPKKVQDAVISHETIHSRKRSGGGTADFKEQGQVLMEEGLTEIINYGLNGGKNPYGFRSPYYRQMTVMAYVAKVKSGGDRKKAWEQITEMHYNNDKQDYWRSRDNLLGSDRYHDFYHALNTGTDTLSLNWMLRGDIPYQLEDELEDDHNYGQEFLNSEISKNKSFFNIDISNIIVKEVNNETKKYKAV